MAWFKIDDGMAFHAKLIAAGNEAVGAWARMGAWSSQAGTDGFVPSDVALAIAGRTEVIQRLEIVVPPYKNPLLIARDGGWELHDFLQWNPSKEQVAARRAIRKSAGEFGGKQSAKQKASKRQANGQASAQANGKQKSTPIPIPIDPTDLWKPAPEAIASAYEKHSFDEERVAEEAAKFTHWHRSKGSRFVDWEAAFANWLIKAEKIDAERRPKEAPSNPSQASLYPTFDGTPNPDRWSK